MYVQGVSTLKVKAVTEELCGHAFSAFAVSAINKRLDETLSAFATRPLAEPFAYLILDARYEKVRERGVVMSQAVLIAVRVDWDDVARSSPSRWPTARAAHPGRLPARLAPARLNGVEFVVADEHAALRASVREVLPEAAFQRCYVHFLRNVLERAGDKRRDHGKQERTLSHLFLHRIL